MVIELLLSEKAEVKQTKKSVILRSAFVEHKNNNNKKSTVITESFLECSLGVFGSSDRYQWWREIQSVTLNTGRTEILTDDHILWILWLNSSNICTAEMFMQVITFPDGNEIFWDRLKMDYKTRSLTITNIINEHKGLYESVVCISRDSKASNMIFIVKIYSEYLLPLQYQHSSKMF